MKHDRSVAIVVDQRLGQLWSSDHGVVGIDLLPAARAALDELHGRGVAVWLLADLDEDGCEMLGWWVPGIAGVLSCQEGRRTCRAALREVAHRSGGPGVVAAADRVVRAAAGDDGWQAVVDPSVVAWVLDGDEPCLARIDAGDDVLDRLPHLLVAERDADGVLAFTTGGSLAAAAVAGATVHRLPIAVSRQDAVWVRASGAAEGAAAALRRRTVLLGGCSTVLVAVDADDDLADHALHAAHGHFTLVAPSPGATAGRRASPAADAPLVRWPWRDIPEVVLDPPPVICPPPCECPTRWANDVERYAGLRPLDASGAIVSRHVRHPDNDRAVDALLADLTAIGYCPWVHTFSHAGRTVRNVLADLPGRGWFVRPEVLDKVRRIVLDPHLLGDATTSTKRIRQLGRDAAYEVLAMVEGKELADPEVLERLRVAARLEPWLPWWRLRCLLAGFGAGLVVVGCHLDSTASFDGGYDAATDPAPGADDDASGIAGTLAVARELWQHRGTLRHTVRFAFFNAEEEGLVGSAAYASHLAAFDAPVEAVVCMDMIGFDSGSQRRFEVHAGSTNPTIRDASEAIAHRVAAWSATLDELPAPQIYRGTNPGGGADRTVYDGAIGRSDHAPFQANGYPAVVVSEDFFADLASGASSDANPSYHRGADNAVDADYGAAIACAVAHTVRDIAANGL